MAFAVCILRCVDDSLYVGHTDDIESRVATHQAGRGALWTARRLPVVLVYSEPAATREAASDREKQLKGWTRAKKMALIDGDLRSLHDLARRRT